MAQNQKISELFMSNIDTLPLWVKQMVYRNIDKSLKDSLSEFMALLNPTMLLQEIVPKITFKGKRELEERKNINLTGDYYIFLANALNDFNIFEIALNNFWTLAEISKMVVKCSELEYIESFEQDKNYSVAQFLAGKIRTGELLRKLGKLDVMQLEQAIREQKARQEAGDNTRIATIMVQMGLICESDINVLLTFKDEAERRFVMGLGLTTLKFDEKSQTHREFLVNLQREFKRLDQENRILKARLKKILNIKD